MSKKFLKTLFEYALWGAKGLLAFLVILFSNIALSYVYFMVDLVASLYQKYQDDNDLDLSLENFQEIKNSSRQLQKKFDIMAISQERYEKDREIKENSLKLLNKLISEGLIREKDLLSLAGTSDYFQLFVYSSSLRKLANSLGLENLDRQYPIFLEHLGFARLGKNSSSFIINKNNLQNKQLKDIKEMKKFLVYHFSKIRSSEWKSFLKHVEVKNKKEFLKLRDGGYKQRGYLKYNFLITETNMNPTNIGFVDNDYIGLGDVSRSKFINSQILEKNKLGKIEVGRKLKIKIKKIINKLDISLLLDGVTKENKDLVDLKQDIIKKDLQVENVIDFYKINTKDLSTELVKIGMDKRKTTKIAKTIINTTQTYKSALQELNIDI